jgi:hypothetical protein
MSESWLKWKEIILVRRLREGDHIGMEEDEVCGKEASRN